MDPVLMMLKGMSYLNRLRALSKTRKIKFSGEIASKSIQRFCGLEMWP